MTTAGPLLVDLIAEAADDERLRQRDPCDHVAPVARIVYDASWWLCECGQVGCSRTWLVSRRPGDGAA